MQRICKLIAMTKAISEANVWELYEATGSIDEVLRKLRCHSKPQSQPE